MDTIHGLANHPELKQNIDMLEKSLNDYSNNQCDYSQVALWFGHTLNYMLDEAMKEFPECMGKDRSDQIENLLEAGYLTDDQAKIFRDMKQAADADGNSYTARKSYHELKQIFDDLCSFLPSFLNWFILPSQKELPVYTPGEEGKNRRARKKNTKTHSHRMSRRNRRLLIYLVVLLVLIIGWAFMLYQGRQFNDENADIWEEYGFTRGDMAEDLNAEHFAIGQTWTVEGEWELTIDSVTAVTYTNDTNGYYGMWGRQDAEQEYQLLTISYHYTNLGYENYYDSGLSISLANGTIIDGNGQYAQQTYVNTDMASPPAVALDETAEASQEFLVETNVYTATLTYTYPGTDDTAVFELSWEPPGETA